MGILNKVKEFFNNKKDERLGSCWIDEVLPLFHDYAKTTNKTVKVIDKIIEQDIVGTFNLDAPILRSRNHIKVRRLVTQNNIPIKFGKRQNVLNNDEMFTKENYKTGRCIYLKGLGYLGNLDSTLKTWIVTDGYVFFNTVSENPSIRVYSYDELKRLNPEFLD